MRSHLSMKSISLEDEDDEFGPACMCQLCSGWGWHDSAPWWAKFMDKHLPNILHKIVARRFAKQARKAA